jgi:hypothetical protein
LPETLDLGIRVRRGDHFGLFPLLAVWRKGVCPVPNFVDDRLKAQQLTVYARPRLYCADATAEKERVRRRVHFIAVCP